MTSGRSLQIMAMNFSSNAVKPWCAANAETGPVVVDSSPEPDGERPMDRKEKLLSGLDMSTETGVEIGALCLPVVARSDGTIFYVDHASTEDLREKYKNDPNVDIDSIVKVDAVW